MFRHRSIRQSHGLGCPQGGSPLLPWDVGTVYTYIKRAIARVARVFVFCMKRKADSELYGWIKPLPKTSKQMKYTQNWKNLKDKQATLVVRPPQVKKAQIVANPRIGGFLGIEKKFLDSSASHTVVSPTDCTGGEADPTTLNCLNGIAQGDGESQRDGKNYIIKGITFDGIVYRSVVTGAATASASQSCWTTVAIVLDTQTNGTQLNSEDVYTNPSASANGNADLLRNLQYSQRFKVLKKWICHDPIGPNFVHNGATYDIGGTSHNISFYADNLDIKVSTNGTGNTVSSIVDNSLHVVAFTNGVNTVSLRYNCRIRFVG